MKYAALNNSSLLFSKIILGTWQAGKSLWTDIKDEEIISAIQRAIEVGITTIDTAMEYGNGYSEKIIAKALKKIPRDKYQLATKVFSNKLHYMNVLHECEKSLQNLQVDYIDLYQIHWPSGSFGSEIVPISETMDALNKLKEDGKILHIGVSNFSKKQIEEAQQFGEVASNQPPYSLLWRYYDKETNPFCRKNQISILAYSPLAQGILTGKFGKGHQFQKGDHRVRNKLMHPKIYEKVEVVLDGLKEFAEKYQTTMGNVALNWLVSQPETFAIAGARNPKQVEENAKACDFQLTEDELKTIDKLSDAVTHAMHQNEMMWEW